MILSNYYGLQPRAQESGGSDNSLIFVSLRTEIDFSNSNKVKWKLSMESWDERMRHGSSIT